MIAARRAQRCWKRSARCYLRSNSGPRSARTCARSRTRRSQSLADVGFFRLLQPEQWGGYQVDPVTFYEAVRRIGSACGSTGWVSSIIGVHNWHLALFPQQAQEDVWGEDTSVRISSSYAPMGMGEVVDGGYKVNGVMGLVVGMRSRRVGGPRRPGHQERQARRLRQLPDPALATTRSATCGMSSGLKGTGSNTIDVKDVFVPSHRMLSFRAMSTGTVAGAREEHRARLQDALGLRTSQRHLGTDRRNGLRRLRGPRRASGQARARRLRRREGEGRPVRARCVSPRRPATSTPRGRQLSGNLQAEYDLTGRRRRGPDGVAAQGSSRPGARHRRGRSPRSTASSRTREPTRSTATPRSSGSGAMPTPGESTLQTTPSVPTWHSATASSASRSGTRWSDTRNPEMVGSGEPTPRSDSPEATTFEGVVRR